jgi:hypothetical protein
VTAQPAFVLPLCVRAGLPSLAATSRAGTGGLPLPVGDEPMPHRSLLMPPRRLAEEEDDEDDVTDTDDDDDDDDDEEDEEEEEEDEDEDDDEDEDEDDEDEDENEEEDDDAPPARRR